MAVNEDFPLALCSGTVLVGQYVIEKVLGQGGFGITYMATDHKTGEKVAVKEFFPDSLAYREGTQVISYPGERDENYQYGKESFLQEAQTLAQFIGNKNIVHIHSYFEENGTAYFVMDYIEGTSFDEYLKQNGGKISVLETEKILIPIMDALESVHAKGIVHRDVTPDNIYICNDGTIKLLDFGAARYSLGDKSKSLDIILKHGFAPKEQYTRHGRQGPYTDIYSLAATFYFAITGRRPPDSIDRLDEDDLIPPSSLGVDITDYQERALYMALEVQPQNRFASMSAFKNVLLNENPGQTQAIAGYAASPVTAVGSTVSAEPYTTVNTSGGFTESKGNVNTPPAPKPKKFSGKKIAIIAAAAVAVAGISTAILTPLLKDDNTKSSRNKNSDSAVDAFIDDPDDDITPSKGSTKPPTTESKIPDATDPPEPSAAVPTTTKKVPATTTAPTTESSGEGDFVLALGKDPDKAFDILQKSLSCELLYYSLSDDDHSGVKRYTKTFYTSKTNSAVPWGGIDFNSVSIEYTDDNVVFRISFHYSDSESSKYPYTYHTADECLDLCSELYQSFCEVFGEPIKSDSENAPIGNYTVNYAWWIWELDKSHDVWLCGGENLWGSKGYNDVIMNWADLDLTPDELK